MASLRYNNQGGTLGGSLTSGGTTITFAVAPDFATLTGGQTITLVLEPGTSNMEIVYLTAYTASATTGTITRQAEDSSNWPAVSHASGVPWSATPTINDFNLLAPIDTPTFTGTVTMPTAAVTANETLSGDLLMPTSSFSTATGGFVGGGIRSSIGHIISNTFTQSVGPVVTTAAGASVGANITSATSLIVADTINPPTTGTLNVPTSGGTAVVTYTGYNSGTKTFTGVSFVSGSGTILATVGGVQNPASTFDSFLGTPLLIEYNPTINYQGGVGVLGANGPSTFTSAPIGPRGLVEVEGTYVFQVSNSWFIGLPPVFQNEMTYKNDPAVAASFCVGEGFVNVPIAIGDTVAANFVPIQSSFNQPGAGQNWTCGFTDIPVFKTINGGTLGATNPGQTVSFFSAAEFLTGTTVSQRLGMLVTDASVSGTLTTQYGIRIGNLQANGIDLLPFSAATNNIGIDCASPVILGGASNTLTVKPPILLQIAPNTYTYNYSSVTIPSAFSYGGTHVLQQSGASGMQTAFGYSPVYVNLSSVVANLGGVTGITAAPTFKADTKTLTASGSTMFSAAPQLSVVNSGTLTHAGLTSFGSTAIVAPGATVTSLVGFAANSFIAAGGAVTTQIGVDVAAMTAATTNIGIRNASPTVNTPSAAQVLGAAFTVSANASTVQCTSTAARTGLTTGPTIAAPVTAENGKTLTIINANTTTANTMTFTSGATELLSLGAATRVVGAGGSLTLVYNSTFARWVEVAFSAGGN